MNNKKKSKLLQIVIQNLILIIDIKNLKKRHQNFGKNFIKITQIIFLKIGNMYIFRHYLD